MKPRFTSHLSYTFSLLIASSMIMIQTLAAATVTGRVTDASTGSFLPGANITLEGTSQGAASDRTGVYRIANVAAGSYTLRATYVGYDDFSVEITVTDEPVAQDVQLQAAFVELGAVTVQGLRQGQAKALSQQRSSDHIMNVVSSDQMQRFPDVNVAESLQRIPGLSVQRDQGEGRYVIVRGMEPRLNSMMINGQRIPSPESSIRNPALDVVPSNQLASVEVTKALTPDMDGDA
ncbi:MAG: carboxypeptidase-like regulatory domain-containing protein, partial [Fidelibacterota bacterium]